MCCSVMSTSVNLIKVSETKLWKCVCTAYCIILFCVLLSVKQTAHAAQIG